MDLEIKDTHVLITGASGGIGLISAKTLLEEGARVTLHYNTSDDSLNSLISEYPDQTCKLQANVTNEGEVSSLVKKAILELGPIHSIIINHGIWIENTVPLWEMSTDQWNKTIGIDLTGAFYFAREFLKQLKDIPTNTPNVSIIFVGSTAGKFGEANHADYATAKAGLMYGMTRSLKNEIVTLHPRARVNSVMPGWIVTPMAKQALEDTELVNRVLQTIPLNKVGVPEDVANSIAFLVSEKASGHISGQIMEVSGGMEGRVLR